MIKHFKKFIGPLVSLFFLLNMTSVASAETTVSAEVGFIFNTFLFLVCGFLVMFMAAGFAMLESGMVTSKSVSVICAKNIGLFSIAGIMFWLFGYNLAYGIPEGGFIGKFIPWSDGSKVETGYSDGSDWYFQMVFCATTVSIVSGTLAERIKLWPFFLFAALLSGIIFFFSDFICEKVFVETTTSAKFLPKQFFFVKSHKIPYLFFALKYFN